MDSACLIISHSDHTCRSGIQRSIIDCQKKQVFSYTVITSILSQDDQLKPVLSTYPAHLLVIDQLRTIEHIARLSAIKIESLLDINSLKVVHHFVSKRQNAVVILELFYPTSQLYFESWCQLLLSQANVVIVNKEDLNKDQFERLINQLKSNQLCIIIDPKLSEPSYFEASKGIVVCLDNKNIGNEILSSITLGMSVSDFINHKIFSL